MPSKVLVDIASEGASALPALDATGAQSNVQALLNATAKDIGDEVVYTDLYPDADPAADNLANINAAIAYLVARQKRGTLVFPQGVWNISGSIVIDAVVNIGFRGFGASIKLNRTANGQQHFRGTGAKNIRFEGLTLTSNYATSGFSGHIMSFKDCSGFRIKNITMRDNGYLLNGSTQDGGSILFYTDDRGASGLAFDNRVEDCVGYETGGFKMESQKDSFVDRCTVYDAKFWPFNLKNVCDGSWMRDCTAFGSNNEAFVLSDDGPSVLGAGVRNGGFLGCTAAGVRRGLSTNKLGENVYCEVSIDQAGGAFSGKALTINGYCQPAVYRIRLYNLDTTAPYAITCDSDHQSIEIDYWDGTGTALMEISANSRRGVRTRLAKWKTTSTLTNPFASSVDLSAHASNYFVAPLIGGYQYGFASDSVIPYPVFGQPFDYNRTRVNASGDWSLRTNGVDRFQFSTSDAALRPSSGSSIGLGTSANPWASSFITRRYYTATVSDSEGAGSPEGVVTAGIGSTYRRRDGGAGTSFYVKESGTGNTGWVAK